ncbi:hypothetical protein [Alysiella filiformis]|uniref:Uncharacterized protein n=1 Tax=Alysiella filiformis DSM 16848 TaxID=1120981 RepID=A0A286EA54_9NEIS|nr:hypothetical protein [Alysiella filiformis]QMT31343.1 hypothetical protein H3L97_11785 [Alysiella filiformis]UBQ55650.1 hypothetical protein JF568_08680 [Alysiella filiformis DSM 16848]SOD67766.1 hypothetical protein SAMN02746062_01027 [Alysiella filiformis DSM 16848]
MNSTNNQQPTNDNLKLADYYLGFLRNLTPTTIFAIFGISLFKQNHTCIGIILLIISILILLVNIYEFTGKLDKSEQESPKIIKNPIAIPISIII